MAKLAGVVDDVTTLPEGVRGFYVEQDGKYVLDADVESHPALAGLKSALQHQKDATREAKDKLKGFAGVDVEEFKRLRDEAAKRGDKGTGEEHDTEKLVKKRVEAALAEVQPQLAEVEKLRAENRSLKLHGTLSKAALEAGVLAEALDDALSGSDRFFQLKDGKVVVLDADGDPTALTPEKFYAETFRKLKPWYYAAKNGSGAGTEASKGGARRASGTLTGEELMKLPPTERMNLARAAAGRK